MELRTRIRRLVAARDPVSLFALAFSLLTGLCVRLVPALAVDFPIHDGGLFYTIAVDIQRANFALPTYTTYNAAHIPVVP